MGSGGAPLLLPVVPPDEVTEHPAAVAAIQPIPNNEFTSVKIPIFMTALS
jgi:hypothetical protein